MNNCEKCTDNRPRIGRLVGVTRTMRCAVYEGRGVPTGTPQDLTGLTVVVRVRRDGTTDVYTPGFVIEGADNNIVKFSWPAERQAVGDYTIDVSFADGSNNANRVDWHGPHGIRLVAHSYQVYGEDAIGIESNEEVGLIGYFTTNGVGMSAYEEWIAQGHTGSEADFIAWLRQPAEEASEAANQAEALRAEAEQARVEAENARVAAEAARVTAEQARVNAEALRVAAEAARVTAESARVSAEESRVEAERLRVSAENLRESAEADRASAESARVAAENARVAAEASRVTAEQARVNAEALRVAAEAARVDAENARVAAEEARADAESARASAESARVAAENARVAAEASRVTAEQARVEAENARVAEFARFEAMIAAKAAIADLLDGTLVPALAGNLKSWDERDALSVDDVWSDIIRTTAGDKSIDSAKGARLLSIVAQNDFSASAFKTTGFNLLHDAVSLSTGYYFPVPAMAFGTFGTATQPNGVLFTDNNGENLKPTVRFKAISAGVPTSLSDGSACAYTDSNGLRFFTTPGPGYLIVSGITLANTCAHIGWSRRYNDFISPTAAGDAGSSIALSSILSAVHSDVNKLLAVGRGANLVSDRIDFDGTRAVWTRKVQRVKPTWTRSALDEETGLYTYTAAISAMVSGGLAEFETENIEISVSGTNISYQSESDEASTDFVKYQLATQATGNVTLSNAIVIEDWGLEILVGATGSAIITTQYAQGYPDALAQLLANIDQSTVPIICATFAKMQAEIDDLKAALYDATALINIAAMRVDTAELYRYGVPAVLICDTAGAPAAARVPRNWNTDTMGLWTGIARFYGQIYIDRPSKKVYFAYTANNSTSDWVALN